jgi:hypothetical protein
MMLISRMDGTKMNDYLSTRVNQQTEELLKILNCNPSQISENTYLDLLAFRRVQQSWAIAQSSWVWMTKIRTLDSAVVISPSP